MSHRILTVTLTLVVFPWLTLWPVAGWAHQECIGPKDALFEPPSVPGLHQPVRIRAKQDDLDWTVLLTFLDLEHVPRSSGSLCRWHDRAASGTVATVPLKCCTLAWKTPSLVYSHAAFHSDPGCTSCA